MASAEARTRWLRNANHCFVEEGYEGTLKTPSLASSSSKLESEGSPGDGAKLSDLLPERKWWLRQQSNSGDQNIYSLRQLAILEKERGISKAASVSPSVKLNGKKHFTEVPDAQTTPKNSGGSSWDSPREMFPTLMENEQYIRIQEIEAIISDTLQKKPINEDLEEFWYAEDDVVDLDPYKSVVSEKPNKFSSEMESNWIGVEKAEPWWRAADLDELSSFISLKSLEHFENCDLPQPQRKHTQGFDQDKGLTSLAQKAEKEMPNLTDSMLGAPTSVSMRKAQSPPDIVGCSPGASDRPFRNNDSSTKKVNDAEDRHTPNSGLSKAQLLEALCHSQTRAREAEGAAQEAYDEKEHIIKLFLKQASHLFAYKQWLQILQLETLCLQLRTNENRHIYPNFPDFLPWLPSKGKQRRKSRPNASRRKPGPPRYRVSQSFGAFLMGLGLAGVGLLLGWTVGWFFPAL